MIKLRLGEVLEEKSRTLYWLSKQADVRYATIWKLSRGEFSELKMDTLDRICFALDCQPGDLLVRVGKKSKKK